MNSKLLNQRRYVEPLQVMGLLSSLNLTREYRKIEFDQSGLPNTFMPLGMEQWHDDEIFENKKFMIRHINPNGNGPKPNEYAMWMTPIRKKFYVQTYMNYFREHDDGFLLYWTSFFAKFYVYLKRYSNPLFIPQSALKMYTFAHGGSQKSLPKTDLSTFSYT